MVINLYNKKVFAADVLLVSLWALFACNTVGYVPLLLVAVAMRVGLCFGMYRRNRWALWCSVCFVAFWASLMGVGSFADIFERTGVRMCDIGGSFLGLGMLSRESLILHPVSWFFGIWIVLLPLAGSWPSGDIRPVFKKLPVRIYIASAVVIGCCAALSSVCVGVGIVGAMLYALPLVSQLMSKREGLLQRLVGDRTFVAWLTLAAVFMFANVAGLLGWAGGVGWFLLICPTVIYVVAARLTHSRVKTLPAVLLTLAVALLYLTRRGILVVDWWVIAAAVLFVLAGAVAFWRESHSIAAAVFLALGVGGLLPMLGMGYNPYVGIGTRMVCELNGRKGVYLIENPKAVNSYGVRDRYGVILEPQYFHISKAGNCVNPYVLLREDGLQGGCGIYDLRLNEFVVRPTTYITGFRPDEGDVVLVDRKGREIARFDLSEQRFQIGCDITPVFNDEPASVGEIISSARSVGAKETQSSHVCEVLVKLRAMASKGAMTKNTMAFGAAVTAMAKGDKAFAGDVSRMLADAEHVSQELPDNERAKFAADMAALRSGLVYLDLTACHPDFIVEYWSWTEVAESIINYRDNMAVAVDLTGNTEDLDEARADLHRMRLRALETERQILDGRYTVSDTATVQPAEVLQTFAAQRINDCEQWESNGTFDPVGALIYPTVSCWLEGRYDAAERLADGQREAYNAVTSQLALELLAVLKEIRPHQGE